MLSEPTDAILKSMIRDHSFSFVRNIFRKTKISYPPDTHTYAASLIVSSSFHNDDFLYNLTNNASKFWFPCFLVPCIF